jgi:hypothetical protein
MEESALSTPLICSVDIAGFFGMTATTETAWLDQAVNNIRTATSMTVLKPVP